MWIASLKPWKALILTQELLSEVMRQLRPQKPHVLLYSSLVFKVAIGVRMNERSLHALVGIVLFFFTEYHNCLSVSDDKYLAVYPTYKFGQAVVGYEDNTPRYYNSHADAASIYSSRGSASSNYENFKDPQALLADEINRDDDYKGNNFIGSTSGFKQYKASTSFNYNGPHQLETIETRSFHKKSEPYSLHEFDHSHHGEEEHAEIHYHQHKHLHKHSHKQEHHHKHKQDHNHHHAHQHEEEGMHKHAHKHDHKHKHSGDHHHNHEAIHKHEHKQDHKHDHHHSNKHEHKHHHDHKHDAYHKHGHKHDHDHKHNHHHGHKHNHHHGHKHHDDHKHKHGHKHHHGHKHDHKHYKHY